jgi:non-ribosomal peptide synthetase component F
MVVGVLGVLKAGGAYVPLDPGYPAERLAYTLADSAPAVVLVQRHLRERVESAEVPVVELDAAAPAWASLPATDPGRGGLTPDHLAYVIYTSGSTGRPKGVRVPHGSLGATLAVAGDAFGFGAGDRVPSLASFAFDIWLFETLLPLLGGGTVRLVPRERVPDVPRLVEDLAGCTVLHGVPALVRRLVEEYANAQNEHRVLTEDVKFLQPEDRERILGKEREVVAAFARVVAALRPDLREAAMSKPLTMLLFGMVNWMFTWMRPQGALAYEDMAPVVADLFLGGLERVQAPLKATPLA